MNAFDLTGKAGGFKVHAQARWSESRVALFGASGSGKSTILEAMIGLRREIHGEVRFGGRRIDTLPTRERGIGWTPQDAALWPHMSAGENIVFAGRGGRPADGLIEEIARDLEIEMLLDRTPESLSGGERQRVAIARALASQPRVLLFDEPLSAVDRPARTRILPRLRAWPERLGAPLVWVTHDPLEVMTIADRVLLVDDGHITASGDPRSVFFSPAAFGSLLALTAENIFDVVSAEASEGVIRVTTANGAVLDMAHVPGFSSPKKVAIRAEDILIAMSRPEAISAQNILTGKIVGLDAAGEQVHVLIAAGERWTAKVTRKAVQRLGLRLGADAHLVIKAHAVLAAG